jgi:BolA protein
MSSQERKQQIEQTLQQQLQPHHLNVIDESHKHQGHAAHEQGMGHFAVEINSPCFEGKSLIQCHKMVYKACAELMQNWLHALRIHVRR